jgi:hypothetical protein
MVNPSDGLTTGWLLAPLQLRYQLEIVGPVLDMGTDVRCQEERKESARRPE